MGWKVSSQREPSCSSLSLVSFTVDLLLKAQLCQCPTHISDLLMPYELEGSQRSSLAGPFRQKTRVDQDFAVQTRSALPCLRGLERHNECHLLKSPLKAHVKRHASMSFVVSSFICWLCSFFNAVHIDALHLCR